MDKKATKKTGVGGLGTWMQKKKKGTILGGGRGEAKKTFQEPRSASVMLVDVGNCLGKLLGKKKKPSVKRIDAGKESLQKKQGQTNGMRRLEIEKKKKKSTRKELGEKQPKAGIKRVPREPKGTGGECVH